MLNTASAMQNAIGFALSRLLDPSPGERLILRKCSLRVGRIFAVSDVEPGPTRTRAGQVITHAHQRLIDLPIDSLQEDDDYSGLPNLETDDDDQESVNVISQFEVQDDGMIELMQNINIMTFPDEIIWRNKQTGQSVPVRNIVRGPIEPTVPQSEAWAVSDHGASEAFNMYKANDIWMQHEPTG
jgi:hypothetical protein